MENESNQNEQEKSTEATATTAAAEPKAKRARKSAATKSTKAKASGEKSKTDRARSIFKQLSRGKDGPNRKKIIEKFIAEVALTSAGASTYYQKFLTEWKKEGGKKEARKAS